MKVSVIIPVFNKGKYIQNILEDLHKQTLEDFECIVIDDGSTDCSGEICEQFVAIDKRFKVIHTSNNGASHARNLGIQISQGEYITFIDADDSVPKNYLEYLYEDLVHGGADLSICRMTKLWDSGARQSIPLPANGTVPMAELLPNFSDFQKETGIYGYCCGKMFLKSLIGDICFDETIHLAEDFDFFLKLYPKIKSICFTNKTEYFYLQEVENSSAIMDDKAIDYRTQLPINIRYKRFLEKENAYSGKNQFIVSQVLSNYVFFSLFYCSMNELKNCFWELQSICRLECIRTSGRNTFEKWILLLFRKQCYYLLKVSLQCYRWLRYWLRRK